MSTVEVDGRTLRYLRNDVKGWSQVELAERSGVKQSDISRIENGSTKNPKIATVNALANALGVPAWKLIANEQQMLSVDPLTESLGRQVLMLSPKSREDLERYLRYLLQSEQEEKQKSKQR